MTTGSRRSIARSIARVIFSPTTTPMLPPMNAYSIAATTRLDAVDPPVAVMTASFRPVAAMRGVEPLAVRLGVGELQRIGRREARRRAPPTLAVEQRPQPLGGADAEVMRALGQTLRLLRGPCCR